jgi:hypothetical protein
MPEVMHSDVRTALNTVANGIGACVDQAGCANVYDIVWRLVAPQGGSTNTLDREAGEAANGEPSSSRSSCSQAVQRSAEVNSQAERWRR